MMTFVFYRHVHLFLPSELIDADLSSELPSTAEALSDEIASSDGADEELLFIEVVVAADSDFLSWL
jgi:hypothetical protein